MSDRITLKGVSARGFHGVLAAEKRDGQTFVVDVEMDVDLGPAGTSDDLTDTVNYAEVATDVVALVEGESLDLIEALADRIAAGQGPEMQVLQAWLEQRGLPVPEADAEHGGHGSGMQGMATGEQMTRLLAAEGEQFDRLFLTMMVDHHEGALAMADRLGGGTHPLVMDMVKDVASTQSVEISRMQEVLGDLEA